MGHRKAQPMISEAAEPMEVLVGKHRLPAPSSGRSQGKTFGVRRATPVRQAPLGPFAVLIA